MSNSFESLPELVLFADSDGVWKTYLEVLYSHFETDFVRGKPRYEDKRFALKRHPEYDGKSATFWHLISDGKNESERIPDFRRCERIRWPRPIIEASEAGVFYVWRNRRGQNERIVLALQDYSYVVILDDRQEYVLLWTAYCVEKEHQRQKLQREHEDWVNRNPRNG